MMLAFALIATTFLVRLSLGALPLPGAPYRIQNVQTGLVFDNQNAVAEAGNPMHGVPVHTADIDVNGPAAQRISVKQAGTILPGSTTSGLFEFTFPMTGVGVFVKGPPVVGSALNVQNFTTQFRLLEVETDVFLILFTFNGIAIQSPAESLGPLTLQLSNVSEPLQQWKFVPDDLMGHAA